MIWVCKDDTPDTMVHPRTSANQVKIQNVTVVFMTGHLVNEFCSREVLLSTKGLGGVDSLILRWVIDSENDRLTSVKM